MIEFDEAIGPRKAAVQINGLVLSTLVERASFWLAQKREIARGPEVATDEAAYFLTGERLLIGRNAPHVEARLTDEDLAPNTDVNIVRTARIDIDFLAAVIESSVTAFWLRQTGCYGGHDYRLDVKALRGIPVIRGNPELEAVVASISRIIRVASLPLSADSPARNRTVDWRLLRDGLLLELVFPEEVEDARIYLFDEVRRSGVLALKAGRSTFARDAAAIAERIFAVTNPIPTLLYGLRSVAAVAAVQNLGTVTPHPDWLHYADRLEARRKAVAEVTQRESRRTGVGQREPETETGRYAS